MATAVKKLDVHTASSDYSKTYVFHDEDHTLGNAVRHVLMRKWVFAVPCCLLLHVSVGVWETDA